MPARYISFLTIRTEFAMYSVANYALKTRATRVFILLVRSWVFRLAGHGDRRAGESIGCPFSLLLRPDEVLISVRAEPVEASANPWPGSGRTVQISKGRINKRRPTTRRRSQNNCEAFRQHWVLAPHATGGYGCQQKGSIGNVAGVHHGAGLFFCKLCRMSWKLKFISHGA